MFVAVQGLGSLTHLTTLCIKQPLMCPGAVIPFMAAGLPALTQLRHLTIQVCGKQCGLRNPCNVLAHLLELPVERTDDADRALGESDTLEASAVGSCKRQRTVVSDHDDLDTRLGDALAGCCALEELDVEGCRVQGDLRLRKLHTVSMRRLTLNVGDLQAAAGWLGQCTALKKLDMERLTVYTLNGLLWLLPQLPQIQALNFTGLKLLVPNFADAVQELLSTIAQLCKLEQLVLSKLSLVRLEQQESFYAVLLEALRTTLPRAPALREVVLSGISCLDAFRIPRIRQAAGHVTIVF